MADAFTAAPTVDNSGVPIDQWLREVWGVAVFRGDDVLAHASAHAPEHKASRAATAVEPGAAQATSAGEASTGIARRTAALVFRDFVPVRGGHGAYHAKPVGIFDFEDTLYAIAAGEESAHTRGLIRWGDVPVPLGDADLTNEYTLCVLRQVARQWVTGGAGTGDMYDGHVCTMFYAALQCLCVTIGQCNSLADQKKWFPALVALARAARAFQTGNETARAVTTALVLTPGANDMLHKALAFCFVDEASVRGPLGTPAGAPIWSMHEKLRMLELVVRRSLRHDTHVVGLGPGPLAVFVLVPLLQSLLHESGDDAHSLATAFNVKASALLLTMMPLIRERHVKPASIVALAKAAGFKPEFTMSHAERLLEFIHAHPHTSAAAPWDTWALVPFAAPLRCALGVRPCYITTRGRAMTYEAHVIPTGSSSFHAFSFKGTEWCTISLTTPGTYTIRGHQLGVARAAVGNTLRDDLIANLRVTTGDCVFPKDREGYALSGRHHARSNVAAEAADGRRARGYLQRRPLDLADAITLVVTPTAVVLLQGGTRFWADARSGHQVLLCFKNMWLECSFSLPAPGESLAEGAAAAAAEPLPRWGRASDKAAAAAVPAPTGLLQRLRAVAEATVAAHDVTESAKAAEEAEDTAEEGWTIVRHRRRRTHDDDPSPAWGERQRRRTAILERGGPRTSHGGRHGSHGGRRY